MEPMARPNRDHYGFNEDLKFNQDLVTWQYGKIEQLRADLFKALSHSPCGCADCYAWKAGLDVPLAAHSAPEANDGTAE